MLTCLRYALATICFAASVGCMGLRVWSILDTSGMRMVSYSTTGAYHCEIFNGQFHAYFAPESRRWTEYIGWLAISHAAPEGMVERRATFPRLGLSPHGYLFPAWYPALIFALAGVGILRLSRRFRIRFTLIATTVVAALVGIAVIL